MLHVFSVERKDACAVVYGTQSTRVNHTQASCMDGCVGLVYCKMRTFTIPRATHSPIDLCLLQVAAHEVHRRAADSAFHCRLPRIGKRQIEDALGDSLYHR